MPRHSQPIGIVLAGGAGRRLGGEKAVVELRGRPLLSYCLAALREALGEVVVLAKAATVLPALPATSVWIEPDEPRHPLAGLRHALALAAPRPVLACAADLPFVTPELIRELCGAGSDETPVVLAAHRGRPQPLLGLYLPAAGAELARVPAPDGPLTASVALLSPRLVEVGDERQLFNVNTPEDLLQAAAMLDGDQPKVKS